MQNLNTVGYRDAINKKDGLDFNHCKLAIRWLASFHALTYAYIDQYDGGLDGLKQNDALEIFFWKWNDIPNFENIMEQFKKFGGWTDEDLMNRMKQIDCLDGDDSKTYYATKFQNLIDRIGSIETISQKLVNDPNFGNFRIRTFNHGDPWFNNVLFKYTEDGESSLIPMEVKFIDLQIVNYLPSALDLAYFIFSSTTSETRKDLPLLLKTYHEEFIANVNEYGVKLNYTYEELFEDFRAASIYGLDFALGPLKTILDEKEDVFDMDDFAKQLGTRDMNDDTVKENTQKEIKNRRASTKKNSVYLKRIKGIVDDFISMGMWEMY